MTFNPKAFFTEEPSLLQDTSRTHNNPLLKYLLIACIVLITTIKLYLIGSGFYALPDESRYDLSHAAIQNLSELKIGAAIRSIFLTQGRPGDAMIKFIPATLQYISSYFLNLNYYESKNSFPLFIFNFIISCLILIVHYKFSKLILKDNFLALISVLLFGSLTNSYIYLRHALPYDESLLIFYLTLYRTILITNSSQLTKTNSFLIGLASFFGFLVYPGYFPLIIVCLFIIFFNHLTKESLLKKIRYSIYYALGCMSLLLIFEIMSRFGHLSYIRESEHLSGTITQGSFEESFVFIIKYLFEVERITGIILMAGLLLFYFFMLYQVINKPLKELSVIILLGISLTGLFLAYAGEGYFLHKMVFYGRLLHMYFPFFCIFSIFSINRVISTSKSQWALSMLSLIFIVNFGFGFKLFNTVSYPRDEAFKSVYATNSINIKNISEYTSGFSVLPREISDMKKSENKRQDTTIIVNCCVIFPVEDLANYHKFNPDSSYTLIDKEPYFCNLKSYQFEGYNILERENIDKMNLQIKTFTKKPSVQ